MAIEIPRALIEYIMLGSGDSRRQLQDSPILGDVWVRYAEQPAAHRRGVSPWSVSVELGRIKHMFEGMSDVASIDAMGVASRSESAAIA